MALPPWLACMAMAWMAHMAAGGQAPPEYWSQRRERGQRVCVDKLGANTESSIVKTGLARVQKAEEGPKKVDKSKLIPLLLHQLVLHNHQCATK